MIATAIALLIGGAAPAAAQECTVGSEFEPPICPAQMPAIRSVAITTNGATAYADPDEPVKCSVFKLSARQVTHYLARAGKVDKQAAHYTLSESPCHATGTVRFRDGTRGTWRIDRYRVGYLTRAGQPDLMLYCPECTAKPFEAG